MTPIIQKAALVLGEASLFGIVLADATPVDHVPGWLSEIGRLPIQGLLAAVCGLAMWIIYRQSREHSLALARENDLWRQELHLLTEAIKAKPCWWTMQTPHPQPHDHAN